MITLDFSRIDMLVVFSTVIISQFVKPFAFKSKVVKKVFPLIVVIVSIILETACAAFDGEMEASVVLKGLVCGAFSAWNYDLVISKLELKGKHKEIGL